VTHVSKLNKFRANLIKYAILGNRKDEGLGKLEWLDPEFFKNMRSFSNPKNSGVIKYGQSFLKNFGRVF